MVLSYCWGADPTIHSIQIDNATAHVRSNLYQALREFKSAEMEGFLWIDAIYMWGQQPRSEDLANLRLVPHVYEGFDSQT
jgi:hypothetical protein